MKRTKTYIKEVDNLLGGGFPSNSTILLSGDEGAGKTIFSLTTLYNNAKSDNNCLYITFEEKRRDLLEQSSQFGWDIEKLEEKNKMRIIAFDIEEFDKNFQEELFRIIKKKKTKVLVIDSLTTLTYLSSSLNQKQYGIEYGIKRFLYSFISKLKEAEITTLLISQKNEIVPDSIARYLCDGVLLFNQEAIGGNYSKIFSIRKMRKSEVFEGIRPIVINSEGFDLKNF